MHIQKKSTSTIFSCNDLEKRQQELLKCAVRARSNAQAPYSNYFVGAAVLSQKGNIYSGCNVERCSYTQTTHAEQNAIDTMIANEGPVKIEAIAIAAGPKDSEIIVPRNISNSIEKKVGVCGHCLQIIWENCFDNPNVPILVLTNHDIVVPTTIGDLLPIPFGPSDLGVDYRNS